MPTVAGRFGVVEGRSFVSDSALCIHFRHDRWPTITAVPDEQGDISVYLEPGKYKVSFVKHQRNTRPSISIDVTIEDIDLIKELAKESHDANVTA